MPSQVKEQREERILEGVRIWCAYYRANIHRFAHDYLGVTLHLFQKILLYMMNISNYFAYIAARGQGKSYLVAIFCCCRCILYPGTKICIASGTKNQAINIIEKKIKLELLPNSPNLQKEIKNITVNSQKALVEFHNGSYIEVVTANDNARGGRANIFIFDEFRMISFDILDDVLKKYLASEREPGFLSNYSKSEKKRFQKEHGERNKQIYLSSAYFKDHWSYKEVQDLCKGMLGGKGHSFVCGLPYQLSVYEGLLNEESVQQEMAKSTFNEIKWSINISVLVKPIGLMLKRCIVYVLVTVGNDG